MEDRLEIGRCCGMMSLFSTEIYDAFDTHANLTAALSCYSTKC